MKPIKISHRYTQHTTTMKLGRARARASARLDQFNNTYVDAIDRQQHRYAHHQYKGIGGTHLQCASASTSTSATSAVTTKQQQQQQRDKVVTARVEIWPDEISEVKGE